MKIFEWAGDVTIFKGAADIRAAFPTRMDDRAGCSLNRSVPNVPGRRRRAGNAPAHPEQSFARADRRSRPRSGRTPSRTGSRWASSAHFRKQAMHCKKVETLKHYIRGCRFNPLTLQLLNATMIEPELLLQGYRLG